MFKKNKKGISPLIATVLIIGFTIVLAALVITWGTKLFQSTVAETETTSKFSLACTTGLRLSGAADKDTRTSTMINVSLRNANQDRKIDTFQFVLRDSDGKTKKIDTATLTATSDRFAAWTGTEWNATADKIKLEFPVAKTYRISVVSDTELNVSRLIEIDVYPRFTIEGQTKSCESPVELSLI